MAITHFLLQHNITSTFHSYPFRSSQTKRSCAHSIGLNRNHSSYCIKTASPKYNTKCFIINHKPDQGEKSNKVEKVATKTDIYNLIWRSIQNAIRASKIPLITLVFLGSLLMYDHRHCHLALAASGGRMGGRSIRSSRRSRIRSHRTQTSSRDPTNTEESDLTRDKPTWDVIIVWLFAKFVIYYLLTKLANIDTSDPKTSVLKLQIGSLGTGRVLQRYLNRIAESADTSTSKGLNYVLKESVRCLLWHSDRCISGYSYVDVKSSAKEGEKRFDQISVEERGKFDEETLVNVDNIKKKSATSQSSDEIYNEYIVVTIIVAARGGVPQLPPIKSRAQLKEALQKLASISSSNIAAVEVLWTPQKETDSLTEQEMLKDYPLLHPF